MNYNYFHEKTISIEMEAMCERQGTPYVDPAEVKKLDINNATSLADIEFFPNLVSLNISASKLNNAEMLMGLNNLKELIISDCDINDLSAVWELEELTNMAIDCCNNERPSIKSNKLRKLHIVSGDLSCPEFLYDNVCIESLVLQKCSLDNIDFVRGMKNLRNINIGGNFVEDISPLESSRKLDTVIVWGNKIKDIAPLKEHNNIKLLDISNNPIDLNKCSLNELRSIDNIKDFSIYGLQVNADTLREAINVKKLFVGGNKCIDLSFLRDFKGIEIISIERSLIEDISFILDMPNLKSVWLQGNEHIRDYSPVVLLRLEGKDVYTSEWEITKPASEEVIE